MYAFSDPPSTPFVFASWLGVSDLASVCGTAVVAAASPWIGQGESACLVKPYVDRKSCTYNLAMPYLTSKTVMTESELRKYPTFA